MKKKNNGKNAIVVVLAVAIVLMSVGYAAYNTDLQIEGTTTIQKANWDVHFENPTQLDTTTVADENITAPSLNDDATTLTFATTLAIGDVYEFTVDVKNGGTFDAKLASFALTATKNGSAVSISDGSTEYANDYLQYSIKWDDSSALTLDEALNHGEVKTLKVSVKAVQPADASLLPSEDEVYVFTLDMNYAQK